MGNADGLMVGLALLAGLIFGAQGVVLAGLAAIVLQTIRRRLDLSRLLLVLLVAAVGVARAAIVDQPVAAETIRGSTSALGAIVTMPVSHGDGQRFLLRVERVQRDAAWTDSDVTVYVSTRSSSVNVGDRIWVAWQVEPVEDLEPGFGGYVRSQGAIAAGQAFAVRPVSTGASWQRRFVRLRARVSHGLQRSAPGDAGALLAGMVTGDDGQLVNETRAAFRVTGTSHITAVSGSNLSMVAGLWAVLGASGWLRRRWWYQALVAGTIIGYAVLVGFEPPAVRAAIVTLLAALSVRAGRRPDPLTLLVLTAAAMAFADPSVTTSLGFQLSMTSSIALVACLPNTELSAISWLRFSAFAVLSAQLATLPLLIAAFGTWSPIGLIANVLIVPLVPVATYAGALAAVAGLIWAPLGDLLGWIAAWPAMGILAIVHRCAEVARPLPLRTPGDVGLVVVSLIAVTVLVAISPEAHRFANDVRSEWFTATNQIVLAAASCALGFGVILALFAALT